jgi:hypothetical protein
LVWRAAQREEGTYVSNPTRFPDKHCFISRSPGLVHLPSLKEQHEDEEEYGASVGILVTEKPKYWEKNTSPSLILLLSIPLCWDISCTKNHQNTTIIRVFNMKITKRTCFGQLMTIFRSARAKVKDN